MVNIHFLEEIVQQYSDKKIIEQNLKNSIKGLKEFKCKGNCSEGKIRNSREHQKNLDLKLEEFYHLI